MGAMTLRQIAQERGGWFRKGSDAFLAGEPISNAPRTADTMLTKRWREGWLWARDLDARRCPACSGLGSFETDEVIVGDAHDWPYRETCEECGGSGLMPEERAKRER